MARGRWLILLSLVLLAACLPAAPLPPAGDLAVVTLIPTADQTDPADLCRMVEANWNSDWPRTIDALIALDGLGASCPESGAIAAKLYIAHYNYGQYLAANDQPEAAAEQYRAAQALDSQRTEAVTALQVLGYYTPMPLLTCAPDAVTAALDALPVYEPSAGAFMTVAGESLLLDGQPFTVQGVNYYPMRHPWQHFLTRADLAEIRSEVDLIAQAGFNTLRIFVQYDALFTCPGSGAVPVAEAFARLDAVIAQAAARNLRLIVTLHDLPDLHQYPLYGSPAHTVAQTEFLVTRYRDEPAILAWDLRNEGDIDYQPLGTLGGGFNRLAVLTWLAETSELVRGLDPNHLITAGWLRDEAATIPYVDVVSFHHWDDAIRMRERVADLRWLTNKPILLEEIGFSTYHMEPVLQGRLLRDVVDAVEYEGLAGWLVWSAFDHMPEDACIPPDCPGAEHEQYHFGLWTVDYEPKIALGLIRILMYDPADSAAPAP
jgi:hypothetical protein